MKKLTIAVSILLLAAVAMSADKAENQDEPLKPADYVKIIEAVQPAVVLVEYTLQHDKGEAPRGGDWIGETPIRDERPVEVPGYLVAPTKVISVDVMVHPRFLKDLSVRFGDQLVKAKLAGVIKDQTCVVLELARPLKGAKPLAFKPGVKGPFHTVQHARRLGMQGARISALPTAVTTSEDGWKYRYVLAPCLIVDRQAAPAGVSMRSEMPLDDSWKGSPLTWPAWGAKDLAKLMSEIEARAAKCVLRVALSFRSPKKRPGLSSSSSRDTATERNTLGLLIDEKRVLVLLSLKPKVTARLERIRVYPAQGEPIKAKFTSSLKDYGCFVAELERPLGGGAKLADAKIRSYYRQMLPAAEVQLRGETRVAYAVRTRMDSFHVAWRRKIFPSLATTESSMYVFDTSGRLVALPVVRRSKASIGDDYSAEQTVLTPASHLKPVLADLKKHIDPSNVPLTSQEESRLAWLGVVMQPLNAELARMNKVSEQTRNGTIGGLISFVYPDSPAQKAGLDVGNILLRLHVKDRPKPIDITLSSYMYSTRPFPWAKLDQLPEQYYDRVPRPWPPAENTFTRALTDLGFGEKFLLEHFADGKVVRTEFTVTASPTHYDSAARHKSPKALGLTVADMTYEVRRYFQKKPKEPGVIVSKIELGSKASVAGLKPYEVITAVNDKPVHNAKEFGKLIEGQKELRLSVKRWTRGRIVKIKLDEDASK
jgi:S1-C subfamily serine protease